jgi:starch-binding outer membrane protein, SusD/RagB family
MKILYVFLSLIIVSWGLEGCTSILKPEDDNHLTFDRIYEDPGFAEGMLLNAYGRIPTNNYTFSEVATDDAVTNDKSNGYLRMAIGQWSSKYFPGSIWNNNNTAILYLNKFIASVDTVTWSSTNKNVNAMFKARLKGEAYGLRGLFRYYLLQEVGGKSVSGKLAGIPLYDEFLNTDANFNIPRASFTESVNAINADFDKAIQFLPQDFVDISAVSQLPTAFSNVSVSEYNLVFGRVNTQRFTKRIALGYKSRVALLAASPAFSTDPTLWVTAANRSAEVLATINGISGLDANGHRFYEAARVDAANLTGNPPEMLWRGSSSSLSNTLEKRMLPPSLNGNGEVNPSQNLVDAFPMANGYPISSPLSGYNPAKPYDNRDPRLNLYILYNAAPAFQATLIKTGVGGGVNAKDSISLSTRTGYYLRKLIREDINFSNSGSATTKKHYAVHLRYTELFLNYAEAANEAWGPAGNGGAGYSAKDVILAIRKRAGIRQPDAFLTNITSKETMRELIQNERRLELCFEGFRFWDVRRWGLPLNVPAKGVNINTNATNFEYLEVEPRVYQPFMQYGPILDQERLKFSALEQNIGW